MTTNTIHLYGDGTKDKLVTTANPQVTAIGMAEVEAGLAGLQVSKQPLYRFALNDEGAGYEEVPGRIGVELANGRVLNVVGDGYKVHQYEDVLLDPARQLVQAADGGVSVQAFGFANYGGTAWINLALTEPTTIATGDDGPDLVFSSVFLSSSHDGSWSTGARLGNYRMFCRNQLRSFHSRGGRRWGHGLRVRHTANSVPRLAGLSEIIDAVTGEQRALQVTAAALLDTHVSAGDVADVMALVDPRPQPKAGDDGQQVDPTPGELAGWERRRAAQVAYYQNNSTVAPYLGTGWGLYQALNGWQQHERPVRGDRNSKVALRILDGGLHTHDGQVITAIAQVTNHPTLVGAWHGIGDN